MKNNLLKIGTFCIVALWCAPSHALLIGTSVSICAETVYVGTVTADSNSCDIYSPAIPPSTATVVDPGVEFSLTNSGTRTFDFFDTGFFVSYNNVVSPSPDLFVFDLDPSINIFDLSLISSDPLGITSTFLNNSFGILVSNPISNGVVEFRINTAAPVPEPSTFFLLGGGLAGLAFVVRRKKHS